MMPSETQSGQHQATLPRSICFDSAADLVALPKTLQVELETIEISTSAP